MDKTRTFAVAETMILATDLMPGLTYTFTVSISIHAYAYKSYKLMAMASRTDNNNALLK